MSVQSGPSAVPEILYHYTSAAGLQGILDSGSIWATDIHYLNDYTELVDSTGRLLEYMLGLAKSSRGLKRAMAYQFMERLKNEEWPNRHAALPGPFISCFCAESDLLSQWRGYGQGGYALGFRRTALESLARSRAFERFTRTDGTTSIGRLELTQVEYAADAQGAILESATKAMVGPVDQSRAQTGEAGWRMAAAAASIKRDAFAEEKEWRFIVSSANAYEEKFRISGSGVFIPYISVPVNLADSLMTVTVGPNDGQDTRKRDQRLASVERMLSKYSLGSSVRVLSSAVPFRGL